MLARLTNLWHRYRGVDPRQVLLFPDWERGEWLRPTPAVAAALGLLVLFAVGTPPDVPHDRTAAVTDSAVSSEAEEPAEPQYDLSAIPEHIKAAAQRHRLSEELIRAVISVESNFDHAAVSRKGAQGLMQLMPQTSALIGVRDPHSPGENIDAGASHLRAMLDTFNNDLPLALAAYNAGETTVIRYKGVPPYPETRRFVARVLRKMGDPKGVDRVLAKPAIPEPQWVSRTGRVKPKIQMVKSAPAYARPMMVPVPATRVDRPAQLVLSDGELATPREWSPAPDASKALDPDTPISQAP
jgi:hypothetical protein